MASVSLPQRWPPPCPTEEAAIITALSAAGKAEQYAHLAVTLLPSAPEMVAFHPSSAAAALALTRAFARATSVGGALSVTVHDVLTVIPHFLPFAYAIGTELGAPAALGLLLEVVRAALKSATALLSLGNVAAAAELYKYLLGRLRDMHAAHKPASERVTFVMGELADRREHESASRGASGSAQAATSGSGPGSGGGGTGYAQMYVGALCDILSNVEFISVGAELQTNLDAHLAPAVSIERILLYRGPGHAVLHHALRGLVAAVRDLPIAARIYNELRPHGPQWVADVIAELSLPPETDLAPRIIPDPLPDLC